MSFDVEEWRTSQNITPIKLLSKKNYFDDISVIEYSVSDRADAQLSNTFLMECCQLLINSVVLFEKGYYDCSYYSLRQAVEMAFTMVYLTDFDDIEREEKLFKWKGQHDFPFREEMISELKKSGHIFSNVKSSLPGFFEKVQSFYSKINKAVHKQGFFYLYVSKNHPINKHKSNDIFINDFESLLNNAIGIVAIMRLSIDPIPILIKDEEMYYRMFGTLTKPYPDDFIDKYIGRNLIKGYKKSEIYINNYNGFFEKDRQCEAISNIIQHQYIDSKKADDIIMQLDLLSKTDISAFLLIAANDKITKCYVHDGLLFYFSDRNTNRKSMSWSGMDFKAFKESSYKYNQNYDEAFISVFNINGIVVFAEHNSIFDYSEIEYLQEIELEYLTPPD